MSFRINTNVAALNAHTNGVTNNRSLSDSLEKLSSGLRINKAADDASGMAIADSLRSQATALGQAISNANDANGVIQIADKAMDEQLKILDTIKTKAVQAATATQSGLSREAIQKDVDRLIESLNNIAKQTTYNGQSLLSGDYTNKEFQIGAYSNQTVKASIENTESLAVGTIKTSESHTQIGNTGKLSDEFDVGDTLVSVGTSLVDGLAKGDVIRFDGYEDTYVVKEVLTDGTVELGSGLKTDLTKGTHFEIVNAKDEEEYIRITTAVAADDAQIATGITAGTASLANSNYSQLAGLAVGDVINVKGSAGEWDLTVNKITSGGILSFGGDTISTAIAASNGQVTVKNNATLSKDAETAFATAAGENEIKFSASANSMIQGLGAGDVIKFEGHDNEYVVGSVWNGATTSQAQINLTTDLLSAVSAGTAFSVVEYGDSAETVNAETFTVNDISMTAQQMAESGIAKGDHLKITNSVGHVSIMEVTSIESSTGSISMATLTGGTLTAGGISAAPGDPQFTKIEVIKSAGLGDPVTSSDYVQYEVEGMKLDGVQMTDENGNGVAEGGLGRVADMINAQTDTTGVKATAIVEQTGNHIIKGGELYEDVSINGTTILEKGIHIEDGDADQRLVNAINDKTTDTGVVASLDNGALKLTSEDGRVMNLEGLSAVAGITDGAYSGKLNVTLTNGEKLDMSATHFQDAALTREVKSTVSFEGELKNHTLSDVTFGQNSEGSVGLLMTQESSMLAMDIVEKAINQLDANRADLGSVQNGITSTINNITVTQVNVKAAESQIRDVDFAAESATFQKHNILAQSGTYAMSQANAVQQNVMQLLQ